MENLAVETAGKRVIAIIPARGGSQGIPLKNLQLVAGRSLLVRAVDAALAAPAITDVVVTTDHFHIRAEAEAAGAAVVLRPAELSGGKATSESAVLHALTQLEMEPAVTVLIQCTSPFIDPNDLNWAVERVLRGEEDVVFAVARNHYFLWGDHHDGPAAIGHSAASRPRRQDREAQYRETGAFYVMRTSGLKESGHRFFGRLGMQIVPDTHAIEIDTPADLSMTRALAGKFEAAPTNAQQFGIGSTAPVPMTDVDALVMDFDGVHTDDHAYIDAGGNELVRVSRFDGMGVARLRRAGIPQLILSTERNPVVTARANKLQVDVVQDVDDKAAALEQWMAERQLDPARVAYVGNDVNDLAAMKDVGWPVAVADAHPEVLAAARIVLEHPGGQGAVREACERILTASRSSSPEGSPRGNTSAR